MDNRSKGFGGTGHKKRFSESHRNTLEQWFSDRVSFAPWGQMAVSGDTFVGGHWEAMLLASSRQSSGTLLNSPQ